MNLNELGFIRVGASVPKIKVADCDYNVSEMKSVIEQAFKDHVQILCFPELSITSYSCGDLFFSGRAAYEGSSFTYRSCGVRKR